MKKRIHYFIFIILYAVGLKAQTAGSSVFTFLNHPVSARLSALGGEQIALKSDDLALAYANPALLNNLMDNALTFNYESLFAGVGDGYFGYARDVSKWKTTFHGGVQFINYGTFKGTDEYGNPTVDFKGAEYAFTLGAGYQINERLSVGANIKYITSQLETYHSSGVAGDIGGCYFDPESKFGAAITLNNVGGALTSYLPNTPKGLTPVNLQIGFSKKLNRAPLRFGLIFHDLNHWDLSYNNPLDQQPTLLGEPVATSSALSKNLDNFFRHVLVNGELVFGARENFRLSFGYNHELKKELSVNGVRSLTGFSYGISFRVNRFRIEYGSGKYHIAGGGDYFSVSTNLGEFTKKN